MFDERFFKVSRVLSLLCSILQIHRDPSTALDVRDLWQQTTLSSKQTGGWAVQALQPHDVQFVRLSAS